MGYRKITTEEFIEKANFVHHDKYDYSKSIYTNALSKIEIICPTHGSFWQQAASHLRGHNCQQCNVANKFLPKEKFIEMSYEIHGDKYDYSKVLYSSNKKKVIIICPIHGEFEQAPRGHLSGKGCQKCAIDAGKIGKEDFINRANLIHNGKYNYDQVEYVTNKIPVIICCPVHGYFKSTASEHLNKGYGCQKCGIEEQKKKVTMTTEEFIKIANVKHNNFYTYEKANYQHSHKYVIITCPNHGDFRQIPGNHLARNGCPKCRSSISKIGDLWLDAMNVPNDLNHREVRLFSNNRKIRVDGFIPETNTVYEFYGDYWHGNPAIFNHNNPSGLSGKTYGELYAATIERENLIKNAGYNLVFVWESDWKRKNK